MNSMEETSLHPWKAEFPISESAAGKIMPPANALSQRRNAPLPILVTLEGIDTLSSAKHPLKVLSLISEISPSSVIDSRLVQSMNALAPSEVRAEESVASLRLTQPEKAWAPTVRTLSESSIEVSAAHPEKAPSPREVNVSGRLTLVNVPSSKMRGPMAVIPSSTTTPLMR